MLRIAFWWIIPCKSIIPVIRELSEMPDIKVKLITEDSLPMERINLGWQMPELRKIDYQNLSQVNWKAEIKKNLSDNFDLHIFNSLYLYPKIRFAVDQSILQGIPFGVISEASHNPYTGIKRLVKDIYTNTITPHRVKKRAPHSKFVLSASGNEKIKFLRQGWNEQQIFPYGYFPEMSINLLNNKSEQLDIINILCTGYLNRNKGQKLLIQALKKLSEQYKNFKCFITGYGPEEKNLKILIKRWNLNDNIIFTGVIDDAQLKELLSKTDLFIAPGYEEPWGIRINEAILAGIPVIVSDKIGAAELIKASKGGLIFKSGDYHSLYEKLFSIFNNRKLLYMYKEKILNYRKNITPQVAAQYLLDVIKYQLTVTKERPKTPSWLNPQSYS